MSGVRPLVLQLSQKPRVAIEPPGAFYVLQESKNNKSAVGCHSGICVLKPEFHFSFTVGL